MILILEFLKKSQRTVCDVCIYIHRQYKFMAFCDLLEMLLKQFSNVFLHSADVREAFH